MPTVHQPPDSDPPPVITPYFRRLSEFDAAVEQEEARRRGVPPEPWAA